MTRQTDALDVSDPVGQADTDVRGSRGTRLALGLVAVLVLLLLVAFALQLRRPSTGAVVGQPAPGFVLDTYDGSTISLGELSGKVVVLNFWASWCVSCVYEAAELEALANEYAGRDVVFLGVAYTDTQPAARAYLEKHGVTYPNGPDRGGSISSAYRLKGVPETVVIDADGSVVGLSVEGQALPQAKLTGPITNETAFTPDDLRALLDGLLARRPPGEDS